MKGAVAFLTTKDSGLWALDLNYPITKDGVIDDGSWILGTAQDDGGTADHDNMFSVRDHFPMASSFTSGAS